MRDSARAPERRRGALGGAVVILSAALLTAPAAASESRGRDLMPIDPQGEVAAGLATLLGEAPARIYPMGRGGFLHRGVGAEAGGGLYCANLESASRARLAEDFSVILDVRSDMAETTAVLVRAEHVVGEVGSSAYRVFLVLPDCTYRERHLLTVRRDVRAAMCGRGPAIGVERAQRVLAHEIVMRNGQLTAVRFDVEEHDCVTGEVSKRSQSQPLARIGAPMRRAGLERRGAARRVRRPRG